MHRIRSLIAPAAAAAAAVTAAALAMTRDSAHVNTSGQLASSASEHGMKVICKHGLPSHAFEDIFFREGHVLAWDRRNRIPLWVAQHLSAPSLAAAKAAAEARKLKRHSNFTEDASIPEIFRSKLSDYKGSGYDRGHMIPAADAKLTDASYNATFILTNIAPQVGKGFNQDYWERLERMCRNLTRDWDDVWVITGPAFLPKKEGNKWIVRYEVLGDAEPNVAVPTHFWKVILAQKGSNGVMASFLLPNERIEDSTPLSAFMVPLHKIEKATGLIFFENLRGKLQPGAPLQLPLLCNGNACNLPPPMPKNNSHG